MGFKNHLSIGSSQFIHKGKPVVSSLNNAVYEEFLEDLNNLKFEIVTVIPSTEHRADTISEIFYNTPNFDWLIMLVNNISDPFEGLNIGDRIRIPIL